jgi:hypothetical protein
MLRQPSPSRSPVAVARRRPRREGSEPWTQPVMRGLRGGKHSRPRRSNDVTFDGAGPRRSVSRRGSEEPHRALPPKTRRRSDGSLRPTHSKSSNPGWYGRPKSPATGELAVRRTYARGRSLSRPMDDPPPSVCRRPKFPAGRWRTQCTRRQAESYVGDAAPRPLPQLVALGRSPRLMLRQSPLEHADPTPKRRGDEASDPYTTEVCARNETLS